MDEFQVPLPPGPRIPVMCLVAGPAGSGKSTLGRAIAKVSGAVVVDQDVATNPLMVQLGALLGTGEGFEHPAMRGSIRKARYQCVLDVAVDNRRLGRSVVMIAPFTEEVTNLFAWGAMVAQLAPARVVLVWVSVPNDVAWARRRQRNLARDQSAHLAEPPMELLMPLVPHLIADGRAEPQAEARRLVRLVGRW